MDEDDVYEQFGHTKNEVVLIVSLLRMHNMSIACAFGAAVKSEVFDCEIDDDYVFLNTLIEKIKLTCEGRTDIFDGDELLVGQWIRDAMED